MGNNRSAKAKQPRIENANDDKYDQQLAELQKEAQRFEDLEREFDKFNLDSVIHAAKVVRLGEAYAKQAQGVAERANA